MQVAAGMKLPASQPLGVAVSRTKQGVPRIVPVILRRSILLGDPKVVRLVLTFLSLYRVLEFPGKLKLSTITDVGRDWTGLKLEITGAIRLFWKVRPWINWSEAKLTFKPFVISKSASTSMLESETQISTSIYSLVRAAVAWCKGPFHVIERYANETGNDLLLEYLFMISEESLYAEVHQEVHLGRLGLKQEPAGKVRVFAMVDPFTNWLLRPLHKLIFNYLRNIDQDGTFNQTAPILRLQRLGHTKFWCYDLSAATDRLPVKLQVLLLSPYLGSSLAEAWKDLLVDRGYFCREVSSELKYAVGQPMGALSSWAMLALTHHFIVQWAAMRVHASKHGLSSKWFDSKVFSFSWFTEYAVLGDDIVIANGLVAREYVWIMSQLGVGIGLAKSLVSKKGGLEFAKRFYVATADCSPVAFKELFAARGNLSQMIAFKKKWSLRVAQVLDIFGQGFRVKSFLTKRFHAMPKRVSNLLHMIYAPIAGHEPLSSWVERFSLLRVTRKDNWPAVLWEYVAVQQNRLGDILERKQRDWNQFADLVDIERSVDRFETGVGLDLDPHQAKFSIRSPFNNPEEVYGSPDNPISDRTRSMIFMILYFEEMQKVFTELKSIEQELTDIYHWAMSLRFKADEVFYVLEDIHMKFSDIDDKLSALRIPSLDGEYRVTDDDKVLTRNPLLMAKLWKRLDSKLRSKLTPELAARVVDIQHWDTDSKSHLSDPGFILIPSDEILAFVKKLSPSSSSASETGSL